MDFKKKRDQRSRPGRARNAEGRSSGRSFSDRPRRDDKEGGDDKPFRKRTFGSDGFKRRDGNDSFGRPYERKDRFSKDTGKDRPFRERKSFKKEDESEGFERRPRVSRDKRDNENNSDRPDRPFRGRKEGGFDRSTDRSEGFKKITDDDRDGRSSGFNKERGERSSRYSKDRGERPSGFNKNRGERPSRYSKDRGEKNNDGGFEKRSSSYSRDRKEGSFEGKRSFKRDFNERDERPKRSFSGDRPFRKEGGSNFRSRNTGDNRFKSGGRNRKPGNQNFTLTPENNDGLIRLNRYIAASGICSRREADDLIKAGLVTINGKVITEMGVKVAPGDEVKYNGELVKSEKLVYILLNKPKDYITTSKDPFAKQTVLDLLKGAGPERVFPVGRLDRNTTGVLLLTNDGDLTKKLTHPSFNKKKIYHVFLDKNLKGEHFNEIVEGIELEDGFIKVDSINYIYPEDKKQVGVEIHSGKNHIVRRIFEHFGYRVAKLDRVYFAGLTKKNLQRGEWRYLTNQEIGILKMGSFE